MRTLRRPVVLAALTALTLALTGCGSDSDDNGSDTATTTSDSGVEVTGSFGEKPTITVPEGDAPDELVVEVLEEGEGAEVVSGDLLVAHYLGQTWEPTEEADPNVFDNSFDRGEPAGFAGIGTGAVIPGWDEGLVGQSVGSRVLLTIPPAQGYGDQEKEQIPAGSTLVFVVDIVDSLDTTGTVSGTPVADLPATLPTVEGDGTAAPTLTFTAASTEPTTPSATVLITGDGAPLENNIVANIAQYAWGNGQATGSTWDEGGPQSFGADADPGLAEVIAGQNVGTRVLLVVPQAESGQETAIALVIDIIGTY